MKQNTRSHPTTRIAAMLTCCALSLGCATGSSTNTGATTALVVGGAVMGLTSFVASIIAAVHSVEAANRAERIEARLARGTSVRTLGGEMGRTNTGLTTSHPRSGDETGAAPSAGSGAGSQPGASGHTETLGAALGAAWINVDLTNAEPAAVRAATECDQAVPAACRDLATMHIYGLHGLAADSVAGCSLLESLCAAGDTSGCGMRTALCP